MNIRTSGNSFFFVRFVLFLFLINPLIGLHAEPYYNVKKIKLELGRRIIVYHYPSSKGVSMSISNPQNYPILVQSDVKNTDKNSKAPFFISPPLFRLDAGMSSRIKIINTGGEYPKNKESLAWVCVKGIPPSNNEIWSKVDKGNIERGSSSSIDVSLSVSTCIKILIRPNSLTGMQQDVANQLKWSRTSNGKGTTMVKVDNPTPFYMPITSLIIDNKKTDLYKPTNGDGYIAPYSSISFDYPQAKDKETKIMWKVMNDYGGESKEFYAII